MENWEGRREWAAYKDKVVSFVRDVTGSH